jgi:twitching motility protein PilT
MDPNETNREIAESSVIRDALQRAVEAGASDLHVVTGYRPTLRLHGHLQELPGDVLTDETVRPALRALCPQQSLDQFEKQHNTDFALQLEIGGQTHRFRVNYFLSDRHMGACFRVIPPKIPDFEWAGFPADVANRLAHFRNGLVLISGVSGAGKTTTLAMIINLLIRESDYRIITVEEPIEYLFAAGGNSLVSQREVGRDVESFADGLKYGLRQDPDVMLIGEIRDRETAQMALSAAETGHLIFSTLHTRDAKGAISRYADLFPQDVQNEIRAQLSMSLRAVISQHLLPSKLGTKRELALEIMFNNAPIANAIRTGKDESIDRYILTSRAEGMIPLDESIKRLLHAGKIVEATALRFISDEQFLSR